MELIEISLPYDGYDVERQVESWCEANIGRVARHSSHVGELYPWYPSKRFSHTVYCFHRDRDAFLFKLKWL